MILKQKKKIFIIVFSFVFSMQIIAQEDKEKSILEIALEGF